MNDIRNLIILALVLIISFLVYQKPQGNMDFGSGTIPSQDYLGGTLDQQITEKRNYKTIYESYHVKNTLNRNVKQIQSCYLSYLEKKPKQTTGQIFADWQIDGKGMGMKANVIFTDFEGDEIVECVRETLNAMEFPPPPSGRIAYASYTWNFQPE